MGIKSFFGNLLTKANPVFSFGLRYTLGRPTWSNRDFKTFSEEGYKKNVIVFSCVNKIAKAISAIDLDLYDSKNKEVEDHPIIDLLCAPNPQMSGAKFIENYVAFRLLAGNSYLLAIGANEMAPRNPFELYVLRPDRMKIIPGLTGVEGFEYSVNDGVKKQWENNPADNTGPIQHWKSFNPTDDLYGLSPLEAAAYSVDQHNDAGAWNKALLENSGQPSGAMVFPGVLTDPQHDRLKKQMEDKLSGTKNAGKPLLLEGGLDWKSFSLTPAEMSWLEGKHVSAREIALAFNVPPQILGIPGDNTFANYKEARLAFYEDCVCPILDEMLDDLNVWLVPMFDGAEGMKIKYDEDDIPALAPRRETVWASVSNATFLTTNEKREAVGYEPIDIPEADALFMPSGMLPMEGALDTPADNTNQPGMTNDQPANESPEDQGGTSQEPTDGQPAKGKPKAPDKGVPPSGT